MKLWVDYLTYYDESGFAISFRFLAVDLSTVFSYDLGLLITIAKKKLEHFYYASKNTSLSELGVELGELGDDVFGKPFLCYDGHSVRPLVSRGESSPALFAQILEGPAAN